MKTKIDEKTKQILLGSLLGDGSVYSRSKKSAIYIETHSKKQKEYLIWKNDKCFNFFGGKIIDYKQYEKVQKKYYEKTRLYSRQLAILLDYRDIFYPKGKKKISSEILNQLNELGLAIWYCDDGNYHILGKNVRIMTDCFSYKEQKIIQKWFKKRFDLKCKITKRNTGRYFIEFNRNESNKFLKIVKNCIPTPMKYKLGHLWEGNSEILKSALRRASLRQKKYYIKNKETILEKQNKYRKKSSVKKRERITKHIYYLNNRKYILKRTKKYRDENKEKTRTRTIRYRKENLEKVRKREKQYYIKNREKILRRQIEYNRRLEIRKQKKEYDKQRYMYKNKR